MVIDKSNPFALLAPSLITLVLLYCLPPHLLLIQCDTNIPSAFELNHSFMAMTINILSVNLKPNVADSLNMHFQNESNAEHYHLHFVVSELEALTYLQNKPSPDILLLDSCLLYEEELVILYQLYTLLPNSQIILLTNHKELHTSHIAANRCKINFFYKSLAFINLTVFVEKIAQQIRLAVPIVSYAEYDKKMLSDLSQEKRSIFRRLIPASMTESMLIEQGSALVYHDTKRQMTYHTCHLLRSLNQWIKSICALGEYSSTHTTLPLLLLIDKQNKDRVSITQQLRDDYRLLVATDWCSGWQLVQLAMPDIVVISAEFLKADVYDLLIRIKNTPATAHIIILLVSTVSDALKKYTEISLVNAEFLYKPFSQEEMRLRLYNLLIGQPRHMLSKIISFDFVQEKWLDHLYTILEQNFDKSDLSVDRLASHLAISRKTLLRKLQALLSLTPGEIIHYYRLRRAADLLWAGYHVTETAYAVGFSTPAYFSQCFKEFYSATPSKYAAMVRWVIQGVHK